MNFFITLMILTYKLQYTDLFVAFLQKLINDGSCKFI